MIVIDASALIDALLKPSCFTILIGMFERGKIIAPFHLDIECMQVLRKLERLEVLTKEQASLLVSELPALPIERVEVSRIIEDIWSFRQNFTIYDAAYVQLAHCDRIPLITHDQRLARASQHFITTLRLDDI